MNKLYKASIVVAIAALAAACGQKASDPAATTAAPAAGEASPAAAPAGEAPAADPELAVGAAAPDVTLTLHDGKSVALSSLRGKRVLLYFYPKDDTPGCTVQATGLRDRAADLEAAGITVFGVSLQDAASHKAFIDKHDLNFPLVVDAGGAVAKAFDVPVRGEYASRQSFLIGPDGKVEAIWRKVDPSAHAADVLAAAAR